MATTLVLSDLHLGASNSCSAPLSEILETEFDRLVLNGDTVDCVNFHRLRPQDWRVFWQLRRVARERELVLVRGNHEQKAGGRTGLGPMDILADALGTCWYDEYELEVGDARYLVLHGDQFDRSMNLTWIGDVADLVYRRVQRGSHRLAAWLKYRAKHWTGAVRAVENESVAYARARARGCDGVIAGHTHFWEDRMIGGTHFLNAGCWVDPPCSYVRIKDGVARLYHWGREEPIETARPALVGGGALQAARRVVPASA
jgi:UDP-2,3-diacylglucosamine pyrophosphatase LpxH